ncbi:conserved hypothetical protein [Catenulispora acidiphila DSM 44928]|uniref:DUF4265 domain-containing protein n=1 Tax=Catenulispora acidiphila (strain DSM 44928 / JCM 14897 / NBRC 102108 / NRRL B-24433 / ID139908) TaxID=479433 RepID=C7QIH2_CATAD|nr:DUF4265 domain-containing protein [Catenulispora acidiphila]ACU75049.1 conserved hypothetical protein [Catenulispora acidiphila DSM 44928]
MTTDGTASATSSDQGGKIKVWFRFVPREGWLPQDTEGLWAERLSDDTARIENVPFLQNGVAQGDTIRFATGDDGLFWATDRVEASGDCTVRVISIPAGPLGRSAAAVHERLSVFGLGGEVFSEDFPLVAFNVPAESDFAGIKRLLVQGQDEGWWHFEVACMTDAWQTA